MESRQIPQDLLGIDEATHSLLRVASAVFILFLAKLCRDRVFASPLANDMRAICRLRQTCSIEKSSLVRQVAHDDGEAG